MAEFDWAFASIIFVSAVSALFFALPAFLPKAAPYTQGQYDSAFDAIALSVQKQDVLLQSDCNSQLYDCNGYYSIKIDSNDMNVFFENPVMQYGSEAITYGKLNKPYTAYLNTGSVTDTNLPSTGMSYYSAAGVFRANSPYGGVDLNQSGSVLSARFRDSNAQYDVRATFSRANNFSLADSNSVLASAHDSATGAAVRAFGLLPEFWVELPADQNLNISLSQKAWKKGTSSGLLSNAAAWWDSNIVDSVSWGYRIPFSVFSNDANRRDQIAEVDFNFLSALSLLGISGQQPDAGSARVVEYSGQDCVNHTNAATECDSMPLKFTYTPATGMGRLDFNLLGFTDRNSSRQFALYFDTNASPSYPKASVSDSGTSYSAPAVPVSATVLEPQSSSSARMIVANGLVAFDPGTITISFDTHVKKLWQSSSLPYRIPFAFDAGNYARTDTNLSLDVNFALAFSQAGCPGCALDANSVSFLEVNDPYDAKALSIPAYGFSYNSQTKVAHISWTASGTLGARAKRYYMLYFKNA